MYFVAGKGDIYEAANQSGRWNAPIDMCASHHWGCGVGSEPDVAVGDDGNQYVFFVGGNSHVYEAVYDAGGWYGGYDLCSRFNWGCSPLSPPSVAVNPSNDQAYVFFQGRNGDIYEAWNVSGAPLRGWYGPINTCTSHHWGCGVSSAPDVGVGDDGNQYVFYRGGNDRTYEVVHDSNGWHGGYDLCSRTAWNCSSISAPNAAVNPSNDHAFLFFLGRDGDIDEAWNVSGTPLRGWYGLLNTCTSHHWGCGVLTAPDIAVSP